MASWREISVLQLLQRLKEQQIEVWPPEKPEQQQRLHWRLPAVYCMPGEKVISYAFSLLEIG